MTNTKKLLLAACAATVLYAAPVSAAEGEDLNSGFGKDMFAGEEHPAFSDPSIHDPATLDAIAPAAGDEPANRGAGNEKSDEEKPTLGVGGITSTVEIP